MNPEIYRLEFPLLTLDAELPISVKARDLEFSECDTWHAVQLVRQWHSRLPNTQRGPWMYAFKASYNGITYAVALWNNPSGRCLPSHWVELRRMACSPDSPKNTASRFLAYMCHWFEINHPEHERCISYQDTEVHEGTIYKASNWQAAYRSAPRYRDRSKPRVGTQRMYRTMINSVDVDAAAKVRWEYVLKPYGHRKEAA